ETIHLRLRERISSLLLNRVLRSHDDEGVRQWVAFLTDSDLPFLHGFEQRALHFGGCTIDFVREHQVGKDRPQLAGEFSARLVVNARADDIRWQKIRSELDARELSTDRIRDGAYS